MADLTEELKDVVNKYYILESQMSVGKKINESMMIEAERLELSLLSFKRMLEAHEEQTEENKRNIETGARVYTDELIRILCNCGFSDLPLAERLSINNLMVSKLGFEYYEPQAPSLRF